MKNEVIITDTNNRNIIKLLITTTASIVGFTFVMYLFTGRAYAGYLGGTRFMVALFYGGVFQVLFGLGCIVRNSGLFKTMSYLGYVMKKSRINKAIRQGELPKEATKEAAVTSFTEYVIDKYQQKWSTLPFFIGAAAALGLYGLLFILS